MTRHTKFAPPWDRPEPPTEASRSNSGKAIASLVLGILSFGTIFTGPIAVIFGVLARRDIRRANGRLLGDSMAVAGIVTGILGFGLNTVLFILYVGGYPVL